MTNLMNEVRPSDLRGFQRPVIELVTTLVNRHNVRFRHVTGGLMLYAPDGSRPFKITMKRPGKQTEKYILDWAGTNLRNHNIEEQVQHLAKKVNDPVEHPVKSTPATTNGRDLDRFEKQARPEPKPTAPAPPPVPEQEVEPVTADKWVPYMGYNGLRETHWATDGTHFKCNRCEADGQLHVVDTPARIGGHNRTYHPKTDARPLRDEVATQKSVHAIKRTRLLKKTANDAIEALAYALGRDLTSADPKRVEDLEAQVAALTKERDEAVARLALIHEAMGA